MSKTKPTYQQLEKKVHQLEEKLQIVEEAPTGILYYDKNGIITDCNKKFVEIIGSSKENLLGLHMIQQLPDKKLVEAVKQSLKNGKGYYEDWYSSFTAQKRTFVRILFEGIRNEKNEITAGLGMVEDITERKMAEQALRESETRYRLLFDNSDMLISVVNREGICQLANKKAASMFGLAPEQLMGKKFNDYHPGKSADYNNRLREAIDSRETKDYEDKVEFPLGTRWLYSRVQPIPDARGNYKQAQIISYDITSRKKARMQLLEQEKKQRAMISNISDVLAIMDKEGIIRYKSPNVKKFFGWQPEDLVGKPGWETVHEEEMSRLKKEFEELFESKNATIQTEFRYRCKSGKYKPVKLTAVNLLHNPEIKGVLLNYHDITERRETENQIRLNEARLDALVELNEMTNKPIEQVYKFTMNKAIALTNSKIGFLGFVNSDESAITIYDWSESAKEDCLVKSDKIKFEVEKTGIWGEVIRQRKPVMINDYKAPNPLKKGLPAGHVDIKNYLSIPVFIDGKIVSVLSVANKENEYHQGDIKQLKLLLDGMMKFVMRKEAEEKLNEAKKVAEEREERYQNFLKHSSEGIYRLELDNPMDTKMDVEKQVDFIYNNAYIAECNQAFAKMYGASSIDDFIGMRLIDMHGGRNHPVNRQEVREFVLRDYRIENRETKEEKVNGNVIYLANNTIGIVENEKVVRMWGTQTDITQRKIIQDQLVRAKEKAETEESKAKSLLTAIPDFMFLFSKDGYVIDYHAEDEGLLYRTPGEFVDKKIDDVLPAHLVKLTYEKIESVLATGDLEEYDYKMKINQVDYYFESRMVKIDKNKALAIVRDVTSVRKNKQELIKAKEKAEESDRLKTSFLANMSHEIRTPMNGILGFSQVLKEKEFPREKRKKFLDMIFSRTKDLLQIINDIVDISKIESNQLTVNKGRVCLNDILHKLYESYRIQIKNQGKSELEFHLFKGLSRDQSFLNTDYHRLNQVLENLLSNAIKFTDKGRIDFGYEEYSGGRLLFYVKDTGIGISLENQEIIFERFRQVDESSTRSYEGTGLGLSISKSLVELLGGELWVESEQGKGAAFYFTIPYEKPKESKNFKVHSKELKEYNWKGKVILLVEDDPASYEYMQEVINTTGADLFISERGGEGLRIFEQESDIDLILIDIRLPDINGLKIISKIREQNPNVPIIAQTAYAMGEDRKTCLDAGANDYISKPIEIKDLIAVIEKYL